MPYQVEKTVFISYRRTNIFHARAIFQNLRANGYDVFIDYESIDSGAFDQIILNQIKARAHFLVLLTPSALERCSEPGDWLRREIETAIEEKRNIVPLYFEGFDFADVQKYLPPHLHILSTYNALRIPSDYFDEAMTRLRDRFLNMPLEMILHPTPIAEKAIVEEKLAQLAIQPTILEKQLTASEYLEQGKKAQDRSDYEAAIQSYDQADRLNPNNADILTHRGWALNELGRYEDALSDLNRAIAISPQHAHAYNNRGWALNELERYIEALQDLNKAISLIANYTDAYFNRGNTYLGLQQYDHAIVDYSETITLNSSYTKAYYNRGHAYLKIYKYDDAIANYSRTLEIDASYTNAYISRGYVYYSMKDYDSTIVDFEAALRLEPDNALAQINMDAAKREKARGK